MGIFSSTPTVVDVTHNRSAEAVREAERQQREESNRQRQQENENFERERHKEKERICRIKMKAESDRRKFEQSQREWKDVRKEVLQYELGARIGSQYFQTRECEKFKQNPVRVAAVGLTGAGKSCLIATMNIALHDEDYSEFVARQQTAGEEGTVYLENFLQDVSENRFSITDTRGLHTFNTEELHALEMVFYGCWQEKKKMLFEENSTVQENKGPIFERIHGVIFVAQARDPRLKNNTYFENLKPVRRLLKDERLVPIAVITHAACVPDKDELEELKDMLAASVGATTQATFAIENYNSHSDVVRDHETDKVALAILNKSLAHAEIFLKNTVKKEGDKFEEESVTDFVARIGHDYNWPSSLQERLINIMLEEDLTTVELLCESWKDISENIQPPLVRNQIEKHLPHN